MQRIVLVLNEELWHGVPYRHGTYTVFVNLWCPVTSGYAERVAVTMWCALRSTSPSSRSLELAAAAKTLGLYLHGISNKVLTVYVILHHTYAVYFVSQLFYPASFLRKPYLFFSFPVSIYHYRSWKLLSLL
jgi:hypothetical protein